MDLEIVNEINGACHYKFEKIEVLPNGNIMITLNEDEILNIVFFETISRIEDENKDILISVRYSRDCKRMIVVVEQ